MNRDLLPILAAWVLVAVSSLATLGSDTPGASASIAATRTDIVSDRLEMVSREDHNVFIFHDRVRVTSGDNLLITCQRLEVTAQRQGDPESTIGDFGAIELIVATGDVAIIVSGRQAYAGRAEVIPAQGRVVMTESPRIVDGDTEVSGWRITLLREEKKALVEMDPEGEERPTVSLGDLPEFDFDALDVVDGVRDSEQKQAHDSIAPSP